MRKIGLVLIALVLFGGIAMYISTSISRQRDSDEKMAALQKQVNQLAAGGGASTQSGSQPSMILGTSTTQGAPTLEKQKLSREVLVEGFNLLEHRTAKDAQTAAAIFQEALEKIDAKNPQFYNGLGRAQLIAGNYEQSIAAFEKGLALDASIADMQSGIGWARWNQKDYYEARLAWEKALTLNPKSMDSWTALSWIYLGIGEHDLAVKGFNILLASPGGSNNKSWNTGMTMARARNMNPDAVRSLFPLPQDVNLLKTPAATTKSSN